MFLELSTSETAGNDKLFTYESCSKAPTHVLVYNTAARVVDQDARTCDVYKGLYGLTVPLPSMKLCCNKNRLLGSGRQGSCVVEVKVWRLQRLAKE